MNRRGFLAASAALGVTGATYFGRSGGADAASGVFEVQRTAEEWRAILTPAQFAVLREEATERPYTSPLLEESRAGTYNCAGCDLPLYSSETKFDSGTGWPSFWDAIAGAVGTKTDRKLFISRTEVHCARCGGHQGHIFADGPEPTGMRHCINGVALQFRPA